ncbi:LytR/AlgR family response regulator transcription factor [Luteimonas sp. R10]|uniref:LytR/AlgR family response regulator transcription factor n=1 Tax=Luteimonas sp. R10 TaxID=3108176 RepID=UPI003089D960|nr:LytTR family DNA-binding domain-containing protein [Luteimonas sp. R10]
MIRILLADDEPVALERLELAVACIPDAEPVASARNGRQALELLRELKPEIAVLDIQMPGKDGFAVIEAIGAGDAVPEIIFVTAFHEHAVRAFEVHAVDYLLKPVAFDRFREAIDRARARLQARTADARFAELQKLIASLQASSSERDAAPAHTREVWVRTRDGLIRVPLDTVDLITAEGDYVSLHVGQRSYLLKDTMASLESQLDPALFLRVHRSTIVNLSRIDSLRRLGPRRLSLVLATGRVAPVGPNYVDAALDALHARRWR